MNTKFSTYSASAFNDNATYAAGLSGTTINVPGLPTTSPASQHPEWQQTNPFLSILDEVHTIEAPYQNAGPFLFLCEKMS